jgi:pilus assembly protein Flp/PilA
MRLIKLLSLLRDQRGATAIEYALIASLISMGIITAATSLGQTLNSTFNSVATAL